MSRSTISVRRGVTSERGACLRRKIPAGREGNWNFAPCPFRTKGLWPHSTGGPGPPPPSSPPRLFLLRLRASSSLATLVRFRCTPQAGARRRPKRPTRRVSGRHISAQSNRHHQRASKRPRLPRRRPPGVAAVYVGPSMTSPYGAKASARASMSGRRDGRWVEPAHNPAPPTPQHTHTHTGSRRAPDRRNGARVCLCRGAAGVVDGRVRTPSMP